MYIMFPSSIYFSKKVLYYGLFLFIIYSIKRHFTAVFGVERFIAEKYNAVIR